MKYSQVSKTAQGRVEEEQAHPTARDPGESHMDIDAGSSGSDMDLVSSGEEDSEEEAGEGKMHTEEQEDPPEALRPENINYAAYDDHQSTVSASEPAGILHLVHGWIQQGQPAKVSGTLAQHWRA
jgi:hypothetical protein